MMTKERIAICFVISLFFLSMGTASATDITVNNSTGSVADFTSIQAAVDAAKDGDTIIVYSGTYTENIDVNKELTIISQSGNPDDTIVQALDEEDYIFDVTANNVTISDFKVGSSYFTTGINLNEVQHNNINNNDVSGEIRAIILNLSSNNTLSNNSGNIYLRYSDNNLLNNNSPIGPFDAVSLYYSDNNLLSNNSVISDGFGIYMEYSNNNILTGNSIDASDYCIFLTSSNNNTVSNNTGGPSMDEIISLDFSSNNTVSNNYVDGGDTAIGLKSSSNNTVSNNYVDGGATAICLKSSSNNMMSNNTVNSYYAGFDLRNSSNNALTDNIVNEADFASGSSFRLESSSSNTLTGNIANQGTGLERENIYINNSIDNLIYNNYFNSTNNAYDNGNNIWNITKTAGTNIVGGDFLGGNYWSDYAGVDNDGDGLGDTLLPYDSEGQISNGGDYLPLVTPDDVKYNPYDTNQDCEISIDELSAAIDDFYSGVLEIEDISEIIDYYYLGGAGYC